MQIRSTIKPVGTVALSSLAAAGLSRAAAEATNTVVSSADLFIPTLAPAVRAPGLQALQNIALGPGLSLAAGAVTGAGLAVGAVFGNEKIEMTEAPIWKKLVLKPTIDTYNAGIEFRRETASAQAETTFQPAFRKGMNAGWKVGSRLGRTAGIVQGGITGGLLGLNVSGEALSALERALQTTPLPPLLQQALPLMVGGVCLFAGQAAGSAIGGAVGSLVGGGIVGLGTGTYTALTRVYTNG